MRTWGFPPHLKRLKKLKISDKVNSLRIMGERGARVSSDTFSLPASFNLFKFDLVNSPENVLYPSVVTLMGLEQNL